MLKRLDLSVLPMDFPWLSDDSWLPFVCKGADWKVRANWGPFICRTLSFFSEKSDAFKLEPDHFPRGNALPFPGWCWEVIGVGSLGLGALRIMLVNRLPFDYILLFLFGTSHPAFSHTYHSLTHILSSCPDFAIAGRRTYLPVWLDAGPQDIPVGSLNSLVRPSMFCCCPSVQPDPLQAETLRLPWAANFHHSPSV